MNDDYSFLEGYYVYPHAPQLYQRMMSTPVPVAAPVVVKKKLRPMKLEKLISVIFNHERWFNHRHYRQEFNEFIKEGDNGEGGVDHEEYRRLKESHIQDLARSTGGADADEYDLDVISQMAAAEVFWKKKGWRPSTHGHIVVNNPYLE